MRQYLKEKRINHFRCKKDHHPIKKFFINWWEEFSCTIGRNVFKQKLKKEIEEETPLTHMI